MYSCNVPAEMKHLGTTLERLLLVIGLGLCVIYLAGLVHREAGSRSVGREFRKQSRKIESESETSGAAPGENLKVDYRFWSPKLIAAYEDVVKRTFPAPLAALRVPRLAIEVAVFDGTDELILNRGVARIGGTAGVGQPGNLGIAGHRDGFFRPLKDIQLGDSLILDMGAESLNHSMASITIVDPTDVRVIAPTPDRSLTLVTCYPFYFVGDAPKRFIVGGTFDPQTQSAEISGERK